MPNWCANRVEISCDTEDERNAIAALFATDKPFNAIFPQPDWPNLPRKDGTLPVPGYSVQPDKEPVLTHYTWPDGSQDDRWYDWRITHWGVKWDVDPQQPDNDEPDYLEYRFDTAWGPPNGICSALREQFPGASISWHWDEPGVQATGYL